MSTKTQNVRLNVWFNDAQAGKSIRTLRSEAAKLKNALQDLTPGTQAYNNKVKELASVSKAIDTHNQKVRGLTGVWSKIKTEVKQFGMMAIAALGAQQLFQGIDNIISKAAALDDALADVMKTTGMAKDEVHKLYDELGSIDTRSSRKELLELARIAGKLGITGKSELKGFVEQADKINVALSEDLGGNVEETVRQLGKLSELFKIKDQYGSAEALNKIGSAINSLGAASTANEQYMVEFAKRIGGIAANANISLPNVLGLASTLDQLGISSEVGATALGQLMVSMGQDVPKFAKIAGMGVKEFTKLLGEDANEAFVKVLEGAKSSEGGLQGMSEVLETLGIDGARATAVVGALTNNIELLRQEQGLSNSEYDKAISLTEEQKIKNENLAAQLEKFQKRIRALFTNQTVKEAVSALIGNLDNMLNVLAELGSWLQRNTAFVIAAAGALLAYNGRLIQATVSKIAFNTATKSGTVAMVLKNAATYAYTVTLAVLKGRISVATVAQRIWNATMMANPVGMVIAGLTALAVSIEIYRRNTAEAISLERDKAVFTRDLSKASKELTTVKRELAGKVAELNKISPEEQENLRKEIDLNIKAAKARLENLKARQADIVARSSEPTFWQELGNAITSGMGTANFHLKNAQDAIENGKEASEKYSEEIEKMTADIDALSNSLNTVVDVTQAEEKAMAINAKTTGQYEEKLRLLQTALKGAVIGSEEYNRIQQEINKVNSVINPKKPGDNSAQLAANKAIEESRQQLAEKIAEIEEEQRLNSFAENEQAYEKEISASKKRYLDLLNQKGITNEQAEKLTQLHQQELDAIEEKKAKKDKADLEANAKEQQDLERRKQDAINQLKVVLAADGSKARFEAEKELARQQMEWELENTQLLEEEKELIRERFRQQWSKAEGEIQKNEFDELARKIEEVAGYVSNAASSISQIITNSNNREIQEEEEKQKKKKELLDRQLESGAISQEKYHSIVAEMDAELDEKKKLAARQQAKREKGLALFNAVINTAAAVIRALPNIPLSILTGVLGGLQIGAIASEPIPGFKIGGPTVTKGGWVPDYTIAQFGEEGPEWVAPNWMLKSPKTAPIISMLEAVRSGQMRGYATGGVTDAKNSTGPEQAVGPSLPVNSTDPELKALIRENVEMMRQMKAVFINGINANISYDQVKEADATMSRIEEDSRI